MLYRYEIFDGQESVGGFIQNLNLYLDREEEIEFLEYLNYSLPFPNIPSDFSGDTISFFTKKGKEDFYISVSEINDVIVELTDSESYLIEITVPLDEVKDLSLYSDQYQHCLEYKEEMEELFTTKRFK